MRNLDSINVINNAPAVQQRKNKEACLIKHPNSYISMDRKGEIVVYDAFNDYPVREEKV